MRPTAVVFGAALAAAFVGLAACQTTSTTAAQIDTRPLEEAKALDIVRQTLAARTLTVAPNPSAVELWNRVRFTSDLRLDGEPVVIEYLTDENRLDIGEIPPPAPGSRLHVLAVRSVPEGQGAGEKLFLLVLDSRRYLYQYNPTSKARADVTFAEVSERLKRDLEDFLSWHEAQKSQTKEP